MKPENCDHPNLKRVKTPKSKHYAKEYCPDCSHFKWLPQDCGIKDEDFDDIQDWPPLLEKQFRKSRWRNIKDKVKKVSRLKLPDKEALWEKVLDNWYNGFKCTYCHREMIIKGTKENHDRSFSLDHKTSVWEGGTNDLDNFAICCTRCNIVKGTLPATAFNLLIHQSKPLIENRKLFNEVFEEWYKVGRLAQKIAREQGLS